MQTISNQTATTQRTIFITGSTDGIGKLAAINLAKQGHNVYIHGRNATKLQQTLSEISTVVAKNAVVKGFVADLSNLSAVKQLAKQVINQVDKLDVLINNAGVFKSPMRQSDDGLDLRFAVNYFAPVQLTQQLLPLLKKSASTGSAARIINLSSAAQAPVSMPALLGQLPIDEQQSYAQSKLALTIWSMALAAQLQSDNIHVIAVNPGSLLNTRMVAEAYGTHWSSADKGSNILTQLATADEFAQVTGKYFDNDIGNPRGDFAKAHADAYNPAIIHELATNTGTVLQQF